MFVLLCSDVRTTQVDSHHRRFRKLDKSFAGKIENANHHHHAVPVLYVGRANC